MNVITEKIRKAWRFLKELLLESEKQKTLKEINQVNNEFKEEQTKQFNINAIRFLNEAIENVYNRTNGEFKSIEFKYKVHENEVELKMETATIASKTQLNMMRNGEECLER